MAERLSAALAYLREASDAMRDRYDGDCLKHARHIAALLAGEGKESWIGRVRDEVPMHGSFYRHPLIPRRWEGVTFETHYVACAGRQAYDPILGEPVDVDDYAERVFGRKLSVERCVEWGTGNPACPDRQDCLSSTEAPSAD